MEKELEHRTDSLPAALSFLVVTCWGHVASPEHSETLAQALQIPAALILFWLAFCLLFCACACRVQAGNIFGLRSATAAAWDMVFYYYYYIFFLKQTETLILNSLLQEPGSKSCGKLKHQPLSLNSHELFAEASLYVEV